MDEHSLRRILEGASASAPARALRLALWLPGRAYGTAMRLRRWAYGCGLFRSAPPPLPTISVGNLTAGGTGKTPFTIMLAGYFLRSGRTPAILLRGYRRGPGGVSDEAEQYQAACPGAVIEVNPDRAAGARAAAAKGAQVILLDDGFQHLRLRRNLDIVLLDATSPWGGGNCLPGGLLREPLAALARAGAVVLTRSDQVSPSVLREVAEHVRRFNSVCPILSSRHAPSGARTLSGDELSLAELSGRKVVALSGIARPESFQRTLEALGAHVVAATAGSDHADFSADTLRTVLTTARRLGAAVVITEKDRCKPCFAHGLPDGADKDILVLAVQMELDGDGAETLFSLAERAVATFRRDGDGN